MTFRGARGKGAGVRRLFLLPATALLLGSASPGPQRPAHPQRIVSANLCADQYLMALADPGQIAALTDLSRDREMSAGAATAMRLPVTGGSAEEILALRPDLLVAVPERLRTTIARLGGRRVGSVAMVPADSYAGIVAQVRSVAAAIGHPERGEALVARMDARLARVSRSVGQGRVAAYYQRRGFLTGTGTLVDELMGRLGLVNLAARRGESGLARVTLEQMALAQPDVLVLEAGSDQVVDQGTEMLHHPVLRGIPRLLVPQAWTVCGGPAYILAAESLARQLARLPTRRSGNR